MGKNVSKKGKKKTIRAPRRSHGQRPVATLTFFYCGKGDTILVEASPGHWGLIDCNLTKSSGAYDSVRKFVKEKVPKLDFVCLTHPDHDHYRGMHKLLEEHFVKRGKPRFDQFWDSDLELELFFALAEALGRDEYQQELEQLYRFLEKPIANDSVEYWPVVPRLPMHDTFGEFSIIGISPRPNRVKRFKRRKAKDITGLSISKIRAHAEESNDLSAILVFMHQHSGVNIVMGGDASKEVWEEALDTWEKLAQRNNRPVKTFACVKVSHHGAYDSSSKGLYRDYCTRKTVAILTVGPGDRKHPDQRVLRLLRKRGIRCYATCTATRGARGEQPPARGGSTLPLPGTHPTTGRRTKRVDAGYTFADIEVSISSDGKLLVR